MENVKAKAHIVSELQEQIPTSMTQLRAMRLHVPAAVCMNRFDEEAGQSMGSENKICILDFFWTMIFSFPFTLHFRLENFPYYSIKHCG